MHPEDLDISSIYIYTHTPVLQLAPCSSLLFALNAVINSCTLCSSRACPAPSSLGSGGREKRDAKAEAGPIRWALAGIDLSPAHLPPAVGAWRAKVALMFFLWQLQGRQGDWEEEKGGKEKKMHSMLFNLCFRHYCSEMENHHIKELFENQR